MFLYRLPFACVCQTNSFHRISCFALSFIWLGKNIRCYEALDGKNPIMAVATMPAPHCSVVFASADSVLRFIDARKPGLQVLLSPFSLIHFMLQAFIFQLNFF